MVVVAMVLEEEADMSNKFRQQGLLDKKSGSGVLLELSCSV